VEAKEGIVIVVCAIYFWNWSKQTLQHCGLLFRIYNDEMPALSVASLSCLIPSFRYFVNLVVANTGKQFVTGCGAKNGVCCWRLWNREFAQGYFKNALINPPWENLRRPVANTCTTA
jgi:hypothetical protein